MINNYMYIRRFQPDYFVIEKRPQFCKFKRANFKSRPVVASHILDFYQVARSVFSNRGRFEKGWGPVLSNRNPLICMQYLKMSVCKSLVYKWRFLKWPSTYYLFQCAIFRRRLERTEESGSVNIFNSRGPGGQGVFSKNINIELMKLHLVVALQLILKFDWQMSDSLER